MKFFFVVSSKIIFICRRCNKKFSFNNKFYYHIRRCKITKSIVVVAVFKIIEVFHSQFISFKIIHSIASTKTHFNHDFRSWRYVKIKTNINLKNLKNLNDLCFDINCESSIIDRLYLTSKRFDYVKNVIHINIIKINDIDSFSLFISKRIFIEFIFSKEINDEFVVTRFIRYVYIIKKLKTKLLLNNNILNFENMIFH